MGDSTGLWHQIRLTERRGNNPLEDRDSSAQSAHDVVYRYQVFEQGQAVWKRKDYEIIFELPQNPHQVQGRASHDVGGGQQVVAGPVNG